MKNEDISLEMSYETKYILLFVNILAHEGLVLKENLNIGYSEDLSCHPSLIWRVLVWMSSLFAGGFFFPCICILLCFVFVYLGSLFIFLIFLVFSPFLVVRVCVLSGFGFWFSFKLLHGHSLLIS